MHNAISCEVIMKVKINGTDITITKPMKEAVNSKLSFLEKFINESDVVNVHITNIRSISKISVVFIYNNKVVKLEEKDPDFYAALDKTIARLKNQISKLHSLKVKQNKDHTNALKYVPDANSEIEESKIVKRKHTTLIEMTEAEAIDALEANLYQSYIFKNIDEEDKVSMVYLRNDGNYGVIICD